MSPTPWLPFVVDSLRRLQRDGVSLPVVYNTSGFESVGTLVALEGLVDVYLADLRYASEATAAEASDAGDYVMVARAALTEMWHQTGPLVLDSDGVALSGTICRLLVLPGCADEAVSSMSWLADTMGTDMALSVMCQYTPAHKAVGDARWGRSVSREEYDLVVRKAEEFGFAQGWIQEYGQETREDLLGENMDAKTTVAQ